MDFQIFEKVLVQNIQFGLSPSLTGGRHHHHHHRHHHHYHRHHHHYHRHHHHCLRHHHHHHGHHHHRHRHHLILATNTIATVITTTIITNKTTLQNANINIDHDYKDASSDALRSVPRWRFARHHYHYHCHNHHPCHHNHHDQNVNINTDCNDKEAISDALRSVPRWRFVVAAFPHVMQCAASMLQYRLIILLVVLVLLLLLSLIRMSIRACCREVKIPNQ